MLRQMVVSAIVDWLSRDRNDATITFVFVDKKRVAALPAVHQASQ
jgi:hypothetical protein